MELGGQVEWSGHRDKAGEYGEVMAKAQVLGKLEASGWRVVIE